MNRIAIVSTTLLVSSLPLAAQGGSHAGMAGMDHMDMPAATAKANQQILSVTKATVPLGAPGAAEAAGFRPRFGWIPTMGEHWVDLAKMSKAQQSNLGTPSNLMFSKVNGRDSLVGAAYAYFAPVDDSNPPSLFDGAPPWHEHPNLAPPGQRLIMLHVWFVPSPDGPFAGTNPNLPFWAVGLDAPDSTRMHDATFNSRVRRAALALSEVADTTAIFKNLERLPAVHAVLAPARDTVRALIPELLAAQQAHDQSRWDRAADKAASQWDAMYAAYLGAARTPQGQAGIERFVSMLLGAHEH